MNGGRFRLVIILLVGGLLSFDNVLACEYIYNASKSYPLATRYELLHEISSLQMKLPRYTDDADAQLTALYSALRYDQTQIYSPRGINNIIAIKHVGSYLEAIEEQRPDRGHCPCECPQMNG
jgi:hypothetical protein